MQNKVGINDNCNKESTTEELSVEEQFTAELSTEKTTAREPDDMSYKPNGKTPQAIVDVLSKDEEFIFIKRM